MNEMLLNVLATCLTAIVTGAISIGMAWLQSKIKSEKVNIAIGRVGDAAQAVVGELQQTVENALKESNGGRLTSEQVATQTGQFGKSQGDHGRGRRCLY